MEHWYDIISPILSAIAVIFSIHTYLVHDKRLKKQEQLINKHQLDQIQNEEQENKKADIVGDIIRKKNECYVLKIRNKGKATAKNINIEGFDTRNYDIHNSAILPYYCLNADEEFFLTIFRIGRILPTMTITYIWNDDWSDNRKKQQTIQMK